MSKRIIFFKLVGISLAAAFILTSCSAAATPVAPASATATLMASSNPIVPAATFTAGSSVTDTPTPISTTTQAATDTATPTPQLTPQANPGMNAYCRKGPGTGYYAITFLQEGTFYNIIGQNGLNTWWLVQVSRNVSCWMGDPTSVMQGPLWRVPIVLVPPLPKTPANFGATSSCDSVLQTQTVKLTWVMVKNVTGYRIYRNGSSLTVVGPNLDTYQDFSAPYVGTTVYELEAFNDLGVAERTSTSVPTCD